MLRKRRLMTEELPFQIPDRVGLADMPLGTLTVCCPLLLFPVLVHWFDGINAENFFLSAHFTMYVASNHFHKRPVDSAWHRWCHCPLPPFFLYFGLFKATKDKCFSKPTKRIFSNCLLGFVANSKQRAIYPLPHTQTRRH